MTLLTDVSEVLIVFIIRVLTMEAKGPFEKSIPFLQEYKAKDRHSSSFSLLQFLQDEVLSKCHQLRNGVLAENLMVLRSRCSPPFMTPEGCYCVHKNLPPSQLNPLHTLILNFPGVCSCYFVLSCVSRLQSGILSSGFGTQILHKLVQLSLYTVGR
jgi:hypothetical protein